jgi:hypothetical protein
MASPRIVPPIDYLQHASQSSLQSFELARLNHAANLKREIGALIDQWIKETSEAMLARWMLDQNYSSRESSRPLPDLFQTLLDSAPIPIPTAKPISSEIVPVPAPPRFADSRNPLRAPMDRKPLKQKSSA